MAKAKKFVVLNLFILLFSIYLPLFIFSVVSLLLKPHEKIKNKINLIKEESIPSKLKAISDGYFPMINPTTLVKSQLKTNGNVYPIGSMPFSNMFPPCYEGYGLTKYKSDRFGLRNKDSKWERISKKNNIFVIGDSFAFGECVPEKSTISSNIENLTGINTLNLGSGGNSAYEYMAILKSLIQPIINESINENWVILTFYYNDDVPKRQDLEKLINNLPEIISFSERGDVYPNSVYNSQLSSLIEVNYPKSKELIIEKILKTNVSNKKSLRDTILFSSISLRPIRHRLRQLKQISVESPMRNSISLLHSICRDMCNPIVVYIPSSQFWDPPSDARNNNFKNNLSSTVKKYRIPFIDTGEINPRDKLNSYAPQGGHLSKNSYKNIADLISEIIEN